MRTTEWAKRANNDWYVFLGGREVAWVSRTGHLPNEWRSVPQAGDSGYEITREAAQAAIETSIEAYG